MKTLRNFRYWIIAAGLMLCTVEPMPPEEELCGRIEITNAGGVEILGPGEPSIPCARVAHATKNQNTAPKTAVESTTDRTIRDLAAWMLCQKKFPNVDYWCV